MHGLPHHMECSASSAEESAMLRRMAPLEPADTLGRHGLRPRTLLLVVVAVVVLSILGLRRGVLLCPAAAPCRIFAGPVPRRLTLGPVAMTPARP